MTDEKRAELTGRVVGQDPGELRYLVAVWVVITLIVGMAFGLAAYLPAAFLLRAVVRFVRWELALGALWADASRELERRHRIPVEDMRALPH